jgi:hypothetical protein
MTSVVYPPATPFLMLDDHPNRKAHEWLANQRLKLTRAAVLVFRASTSLQAAPAA